MKTSVKDILGIIEKTMPLEIAFDWDNCGLIVGDPDAEVQKVLLTLDVTTPVIEQAVEQGANLIIAHHPVIFSALRKITAESIKGRQMSLLLRNNIQVICMHTNCDFADMGLNAYLAATLGLENVFPAAEKMLRIGQLTEETSIQQLIGIIKDRFNIDSIRMVGGENPGVSRIAVFTGKIDEETIDAASKVKDQFDVLVCGEMGYHDMLDCAEYGIRVLEISHYGSEWIFVYLMKNLLSMNFPNLNTFITDRQKNVFRAY